MGFSRKRDFTGMSREDVLQSASSRIYRSIVASEQSTKRIRSKLEASGYPDDVIEQAISRACDLGVLDDRRYCECLVRSTAYAGKGLAKVAREVESLGIPIESLESYQEYMERGEEAQIEDALDFLERHPTRAKDAYASCFRKLVNKGFPSDIASAATRRFVEKMKDG